MPVSMKLMSHARQPRDSPLGSVGHCKHCQNQRRRAWRASRRSFAIGDYLRPRRCASVTTSICAGEIEHGRNLAAGRVVPAAAGSGGCCPSAERRPHAEAGRDTAWPRTSARRSASPAGRWTRALPSRCQNFWPSIQRRTPAPPSGATLAVSRPLYQSAQRSPVSGPSQSCVVLSGSLAVRGKHGRKDTTGGRKGCNK